jgi:hypothetical protein
MFPLILNHLLMLPMLSTYTSHCCYPPIKEVHYLSQLFKYIFRWGMLPSIFVIGQQSWSIDQLLSIFPIDHHYLTIAILLANILLQLPHHTNSITYHRSLLKHMYIPIIHLYLYSNLCCSSIDPIAGTRLTLRCCDDDDDVRLRI